MTTKLKLTDPLPYYSDNDPHYHGDMSIYQAHTARIVACAKSDFIRSLPVLAAFGMLMAVLALR